MTKKEKGTITIPKLPKDEFWKIFEKSNAKTELENLLKYQQEKYDQLLFNLENFLSNYNVMANKQYDYIAIDQILKIVKDNPELDIKIIEKLLRKTQTELSDSVKDLMLRPLNPKPIVEAAHIVVFD